MGAVRRIPLGNGQFAVVDAGDFGMVSKITWCAKPGKRTHRTFYAHTNLCVGGQWTTRSMHRFIMLPDPDQQVDHINEDGLDNRRCNLRLCDAHGNRCNTRPRRRKTSQFTGVTAAYGKWRAGIRIHGRQRHLGVFASEIDAALAYDIEAIKAFGEFAHPNLLKRPARTQEEAA